MERRLPDKLKLAISEKIENNLFCKVTTLADDFGFQTWRGQVFGLFHLVILLMGFERRSRS